MSHYFTDNQDTRKNRRVITFRFLDNDYNLISDEGVFSKNALDQGTKILLKQCATLPVAGRVGDLGCGIGVIGVILAQLFEVTMQGFDTNPRAVELANLNYARYQVTGSNEVRDGLIGQFDCVISNPPIRIGKEKLYALFDNVHDCLVKDGFFVFVIRKQQGALSAFRKCQELFGNCMLLGREKGYHLYISYKR